VCHGVRASPLDAPEGSGGGLIGASLQIGERINKEARRWIGGVRPCITSVALSHLGLSCRDRNRWTRGPNQKPLRRHTLPMRALARAAARSSPDANPQRADCCEDLDSLTPAGNDTTNCRSVASIA